MKVIFRIIATFLLLNAGILSSQTLSLLSPDNNVSASIFLNSEKQLTYKVSWAGKEVIAPSNLGFIMLEGGIMKNNMAITGNKRESHNSTYNLPSGKFKTIVNQYNEITINATEAKGLKRKVNLIFRAYDDGVAFRYVFPTQTAKTFDIMAELSEFNFTGDYPSWVQHLPGFNWNYEKGFDKVTLSSIYGKPELSDPVMQYIYCFNFPAAINHSKLIGLPLVTEIDGGPAVAITEADLHNYGGMYLQNTMGQPKLHTVISPLPTGNGIKVSLKTPSETPWRVIMMAKTAGNIIESNLISNLNRASKIDDVSWIKPGKSTWDFLAGRDIVGVDFESGMNMKTLKYYIDFASEYNLEYYTIDEGWVSGVTWFKESPEVNQLMPAKGIDIEDLVQYANKKNVGLFLWARYDNVRDDMENIFATFEKWGIKGVKVDFMDSDDQNMVNWYEKCLATAAKYHLMINFHGAYKPTGLNRTYPNYITQEGVKGLEWANTTTTLNASHNVTMAYTRMLIGPMDYTPGGFNNVKLKDFEFMKFNVLTTRAHQIALTVVYDSPLLTLSDAPHIYRRNIEADFFKILPTTWDETKFIEGTTGEYIILAKRSGKDWFISGINNELGKTVNLDFSFLTKGTNYKATMYMDADNADSKPKNLTIEEKELTSKSNLKITMADSGGFTIYLKSKD